MGIGLEHLLFTKMPRILTEIWKNYFKWPNYMRKSSSGNCLILIFIIDNQLQEASSLQVYSSNPVYHLSRLWMTGLPFKLEHIPAQFLVWQSEEDSTRFRSRAVGFAEMRTKNRGFAKGHLNDVAARRLVRPVHRQE